MVRQHLVLCASFAIAMALTSDAAAQYSGRDVFQMKRSLAGVNEVVVFVPFGGVAESAKPMLASMSVSGRTIQTRLELRLRQAGIKVRERAWEPPEVPPAGLLLTVDATCVAKTVCQAHFTVSLLQRAILMRDDAENGSYATWFESSSVLAGVEAFPGGFETHLEHLLDVFINDWLAINPRR